jgi:hypothetical protein
VSQSQRVNEPLRDGIVPWELQPSARFNEVELAERVSVLRTLLCVRHGVCATPRGGHPGLAPSASGVHVRVAGRRRLLRCMAVFDELTHAPAAGVGCEPPPKLCRLQGARRHD